MKVKLSKRLQMIANWVEPGKKLADIGSDHAYLPIYLVEEEVIPSAIAGEVVKGPFDVSLAHVKEANLADKIEVRLADGLAAIEPTDEVRDISICGMGGPLIRDILSNDVNHVLEQKPNLLLGPNNTAIEVRKWLQQNNYEIVAESIIEEEGHIYECIQARFTDHQTNYDLADLYLGPFLRREQSDVFKQKWTQVLNKEQKILKQMNNAKEVSINKTRELEQIIHLIEANIA